MFKKICTRMGLFAALAISATVVAATPTEMQFGDIGRTSVEVDNIHHSGRLLLRKIKVRQSTIVNGFLIVENSQLNKQTLVNGHMKAKDSSFEDLTINGDTELKNDIVHGTTAINGKVELEHVQFDNAVTVFGLIKAKDSSFKQTLTLNSTNTDLDNCNLQNVVVKKTDDKESQVINLKATKISGNVVFDSGKGILNMDANSSISGKVTGGTVNKK